MTMMARMIVSCIGSILGAHLLCYILVSALPDAAVTVLGIQSAVPAARAAFTDPPSYWQLMQNLLSGDLGRTLDGTPVWNELRHALLDSAPRLALASLIVIGAIFIVAHAPSREWLRRCAVVAEFMSFLPPFVYPFMMIGVLIIIGNSGWVGFSVAAWWLSILSIAFPAASLASAQCARIIERDISQPFAITIRAAGASPRQLRHRLLQNALVELAPSLEKIGLGLVTGLLFAEATFALGGIGSLTLRAVRRTDIELILALVLTIATATNILSFIAKSYRLSYRI